MLSVLATITSTLRRLWDFVRYSPPNSEEQNDYRRRGSFIVVGPDGSFPGLEIESAQVKQWHVFPEMGFNLITIILVTSDVYQMVDYDNHLETILRTLVPDREVDDLSHIASASSTPAS